MKKTVTLAQKAARLRNYALIFAVFMAFICTGAKAVGASGENTYTREDILSNKGMAPDGTYVSCSNAKELIRGMSYLVVDPETGNYETAEIASIISSEVATVMNQSDGSTQKIYVNTVKGGGTTSKIYTVLTQQPLRMETSVATTK